MVESLRKRQLSFDANNSMKNVLKFFQEISLRACVPNFKVQGHFLQKLELYKTYTAKTSLTLFLKECLCTT